MTRTTVSINLCLTVLFQFCSPSLADGRDLLYHIIPKKEEVKGEENDQGDEREWRPSMNLYELIQQIPNFISETL